jgi:hypothetical protein
MEFLSTDTGIALASVLLGIAIASISALSYKAARSPDLAKLKTAYPVLNMVVQIASETLSETKYGFIADAAAAIWMGRGLSPRESRKLADQMVDCFDLDKYIGTNYAKLNQKQIEEARAIASTLMPAYTAYGDQAGYSPVPPDA